MRSRKKITIIEACKKAEKCYMGIGNIIKCYESTDKYLIVFDSEGARDDSYVFISKETGKVIRLIMFQVNLDDFTEIKDWRRK